MKQGNPGPPDGVFRFLKPPPSPGGCGEKGEKRKVLWKGPRAIRFFPSFPGAISFPKKPPGGKSIRQLKKDLGKKGPPFFSNQRGTGGPAQKTLPGGPLAGKKEKKEEPGPPLPLNWGKGGPPGGAPQKTPKRGPGGPPPFPPNRGTLFWPQDAFPGSPPKGLTPTPGIFGEKARQRGPPGFGPPLFPKTGGGCHPGPKMNHVRGPVRFKNRDAIADPFFPPSTPREIFFRPSFPPRIFSPIRGENFLGGKKGGPSQNPFWGYEKKVLYPRCLIEIKNFPFFDFPQTPRIFFTPGVKIFWPPKFPERGLG